MVTNKKVTKKKYSKMSVGLVLQLRKEFAMGNITATALAEKYHVNRTTLHFILSGKTWKELL